MNQDEQFPGDEEFSEDPEERRKKRRTFGNHDRMFDDHDVEAFDEEYEMDFDDETEAINYLDS